MLRCARFPPSLEVRVDLGRQDLKQLSETILDKCWRKLALILALSRAEVGFGAIKGGCSHVDSFQEGYAIPCRNSRIRERLSYDCHAGTRVCMIDQHGIYGRGIQVYLPARGVV